MANSRGEREADKIINNLNLPTQISGKPPNTPLTEQSFVDVWELELDVNTKEPKILISGTDSQVVLQTSLINALNQFLAYRGISYFNWNEWVESFCNGHQSFTKGASPELKKLWEGFIYPGVTKENRPKIVELSLDGRTKKTSTFKVVQFYPDRKNINEWLIFTGTYKDIADKIETWWYQKATDSEVNIPEDVEESRLVHPLVVIWFKELDIKNSRPKRYRLWFRLMNKVEESLPGSNLLTEADIKQLARKIKEIFCPEPTIAARFKFKKGKKLFRYIDPISGYKNKFLADGWDDAKSLMTNLLSVQGFKFDETKLKITETGAEKSAYPSAPKEVTVLGQKIKQGVRRPKTTVMFWEAKLCLRLYPKAISLVARDGSVFEKLPNLAVSR